MLVLSVDDNSPVNVSPDLSFLNLYTDFTMEKEICIYKRKQYW